MGFTATTLSSCVRQESEADLCTAGLHEDVPEPRNPQPAQKRCGPRQVLMLRFGPCAIRKGYTSKNFRLQCMADHRMSHVARIEEAQSWIKGMYIVIYCKQSAEEKGRVGAETYIGIRSPNPFLPTTTTSNISTVLFLDDMLLPANRLPFSVTSTSKLNPSGHDLAP